MESTNNYMNQEDFKKVISAIPELKIRKWDDTDIKFLFKILYFCALRPMEAIKLSRDDFNINERYVKLGETKTELHGKVVIPKIFCTELEIYLNFKDVGPLFPKLTYDTFYHWLKRLGQICEIEAWTAKNQGVKNENGKITKHGEKTVGHIFRKMRGKDYEKDGIKLSIIMNVYRHADLGVTSKYLRNTNQAIMEVI